MLSFLALFTLLQNPAIPLAASRYRLWSPATGNPVSLVSYAVPLSALSYVNDQGQPAARLAIAWRERDGVKGEWFDTTLARMYYPPARTPDGYLQALIVAERGSNADSWSFGIMQGETHRGIVTDSAPPLGDGPLTLSDVVVGDSTQHFAWIVLEDSVVLAPRGSVSRNIVLDLFVQLRSSLDVKDARTTVAVFKLTGSGRATEPDLQIAWQGTVAHGITPIHRGLDISRLDVGEYELVITVNGGGNETVRSRRLVVR
ncbi:MAG: hypothetical protein ABUL71_04295 [Gemmatimonadota bacterium]